MTLLYEVSYLVIETEWICVLMSTVCISISLNIKQLSLLGNDTRIAGNCYKSSRNRYLYAQACGLHLILFFLNYFLILNFLRIICAYHMENIHF